MQVIRLFCNGYWTCCTDLIFCTDRKTHKVGDVCLNIKKNVTNERSSITGFSMILRDSKTYLDLIKPSNNGFILEKITRKFKWVETIRKWRWLMMAWMETDHKMDFWKLSRMNLEKYCVKTKFPREICFVSFSSSCYSINLGNISSLCKRFEQIHRDTASLNAWRLRRNFMLPPPLPHPGLIGLMRYILLTCSSFSIVVWIIVWT